MHGPGTERDFGEVELTRIYVRKGDVQLSVDDFDHHNQLEISPTQPTKKMTIYHIVLFKFKEDLSKEEIRAASEGMANLHTKCLHPQTKQPYIRNRIGGINNSPEGRDGGMTHGYICEFDNEEDRAYYLEEDPAHKEWVQHVKPYIAGAQVIDFVPGVHV
ncbi:hypothetical protein DL771_000573 [Monosporascus sp. 5C6A]|nr:hypothetical protein DL771_000573 [Monosporascus sp. 5C6A]